LNSLFIVGFAPVFSKWWESKYNISGPMKWTRTYLLGLGFGFLAYGSMVLMPTQLLESVCFG
jgi:POT family proton-dependent oligopeptide transporter